MKKLYLLYFALFISFLISSCATESAKTEQHDSLAVATKPTSELILAKIVANGDFINSEKGLPIITAKEVNAAPQGSLHILDLRDGEAYSKGHIKGAINVKPNELLDYIKMVDMSKYEKIVLVCYSGQIASYSTSVLQTIGYKKAYAMQWGMAAWNTKLSDKWEHVLSDNLEKELTTKTKSKKAKGKLPEFETKKANIDDILLERAALVLSEGFAFGSVALEDYVAKKNKFYLINYWEKELYDLGHLPNAIQYTPQKSFSLQTDLLTLPTNKVVLIYCYSGHKSAFVAAHLRMLGYNAKSLKYGTNAFAHSFMLKNPQIGTVFTKAEVNNFPLETSEYIPEEGPKQGGC